MKLYLVRCRGMQTTCGGQVAYGQAYVAADNPEVAYRKVRKALDDGDLGFIKDRELQSVELIGEDVSYPDCGIRFYP